MAADPGNPIFSKISGKIVEFQVSVAILAQAILAQVPAVGGASVAISVQILLAPGGGRVGCARRGSNKPGTVFRDLFL